MSEPVEKGFYQDFKRFFVRGLVTVLPTFVTIVLLIKGYEVVRDTISIHLTNGVCYVVVWTFEDYPALKAEEISAYAQAQALAPPEAEDPRILRRLRYEKLSGLWNQGIRSLAGFLLAIVVIYIIGRIFGSILGRKLWSLFENAVHRLPLFNKVYPYVKQVSDYLFGENRPQFSRVVAVPYPHPGMYSVGLVTGAGFRHVHETAHEDFLTVFIPSSPTPVTGYVVYVKKIEVIDLPITVEEALRFAVSGGVIVPEHQVLPEQFRELAAVSRPGSTSPAFMTPAAPPPAPPD